MRGVRRLEFLALLVGLLFGGPAACGPQRSHSLRVTCKVGSLAPRVSLWHDWLPKPPALYPRFIFYGAKSSKPKPKPRTVHPCSVEPNTPTSNPVPSVYLFYSACDEPLISEASAVTTAPRRVWFLSCAAWLVVSGGFKALGFKVRV